jgi:hypothetical protein
MTDIGDVNSDDIKEIGEEIVHLYRRIVANAEDLPSAIAAAAKATAEFVDIFWVERIATEEMERLGDAIEGALARYNDYEAIIMRCVPPDVLASSLFVDESSGEDMIQGYLSSLTPKQIRELGEELGHGEDEPLEEVINGITYTIMNQYNGMRCMVSKKVRYVR